MYCESNQEECCPSNPVPVPTWKGNLQTLQKSFDGTTALLLTPMTVCPAVITGASKVPYIGIVFQVYRGGVSTILGYLGDPSPDEQVRLQHLIFGIGVNVAIVASLTAVTVASLPVGFVVAGAGLLLFYLNDEYGATAYDKIEDNLDSLLSVGKYDPMHAHLYEMGCLKRELCITPPPASHTDPLILDLNGNGPKTISISGVVNFDLDANGFAERTGWVCPKDGLLTLDRNGDGIINDGRELFGDQTILQSGNKASNGFEALAEFDANTDGKIDANDPIYSQLRVWQDGNSDGISDTAELHSLTELGVTAINLASTPTSQTDSSGNTQTGVGTFEKADGSTGQIGGFEFQRDNIISIPNESLAVPDDIAALPILYGSGIVYDLHQAMARDTTGELRNLVEQFMAATVPAARNALMEQILFNWAGTDRLPYDVSSPAQYMTNTGSGGSGSGGTGTTISYQAPPVVTDPTFLKRLGVLEHFFGEAWVGQYGRNPTYGAEFVQVGEAYRKMFELMYGELMGQTHLKDLYGKVTYTLELGNDTGPQADMSGVMADLQAALASDPEQGKQLLGEFARTMRGLGHDRASCLACREFFVMQDPELAWVIDTGGLPIYGDEGQPLSVAMHIWGTDNAEAIKGSLTLGDGVINGLNGNDVLYGTARDETLYNSSGNALLIGGGGNDRIWAGADNDILDGGEGNDVLYGETGNDTYIFRRGSGQDIIVDWDTTANNTDTIWLGSNLTPAEITLKRSANNLVLKINDTTDTLTVQDFFWNYGVVRRVEQIQFMDGTLWGESDIIREAYAPTEGDDVIWGAPESDNLNGLGGNDWFNGQGGDDTLDGGTGNDTVYGGADNDTLVGADGDDTLYGNAGNDILNGGAGNDVLNGGNETSWWQDDVANGNDTYLFGRGYGQDTIYDQDITPGNVDTLELGEGILPTDIRLDLIRQKYTDFTGAIPSDLRLTIIDTLDSITIKSWLREDIPTHGVEAIKFADGTTWGSPDEIQNVLVTGTDENDIIYGFSRADPMEGREGDDTLYGRAGDDTLDGGAGNDILCGEAGNDTLLGGEGDDTLLGGAGNDTYLFGISSGQDVVFDPDTTAGNTDTIRVADDLTLDDVTLSRKGNDLELSINATEDKLIVQSWFRDESAWYQVERIQFSDGTVWGVDAIKLMVLEGTSEKDSIIGYSTTDTIRGYEGNDSLYGRAGDDTLDGGTGSDFLYGEQGNDTLLGGEGSDTLFGGIGNDVLDGGAGNDILYGGSYDRSYDTYTSNGNDTYVFGRGSGQNTVIDYDTTAGNLDTIQLNADVLPGDLNIKHVGDNLVLSINGVDDTLTVTNWFKNGSTDYQIERIQFADGTTWDVDTIKQLALIGTSGDDVLSGYATSDVLQGFGGSDKLYGREGNDILDGGAGNDYLDGGTGADTYLFGRGSGQDVIVDYDNNPGNVDTVVLGADVLPTDITLNAGGNDLFVSINGTTDRLRLTNWYSDDASKIERLEFSDGTVWDVAYMQSTASSGSDAGETLYGTSSNDLLDGRGGNDTIYGREGDDTIYGGDGSDNLYGEDGNDIILGGAGADRIEGGTGNNTIDGGAGDDKIIADKGQNTISFNRGDGFDDLKSHFNSPSDQPDTIVFGPGIKPEDLLVQMQAEYAPNGSRVNNMSLAIGIGDDEGLVVHATNGGIEMVKDIYTGSGWDGNDILSFTDVNGTLFFIANDSVHGYELWKSDGTEAGTVMVKDLNPGSGNGLSDLYPLTVLTNVDGTLFFAANDGIHGLELWKSDGTEAGTVMVKDSVPGSGSSSPTYLANVNGTIFFSAYDSANGVELWKSDGTEAGTVMVRNLNSGSDPSSPSSLTNVDGTLFFVAFVFPYGDELCKSDGTPSGTVMVKDINPGSGGGSIGIMTNLNGTLFFAANDSVHGYGLWKSDGTEAGTMMVKETIDPLTYMTVVDSTLFFVAWDSVHGSKALWTSDGTEQETGVVTSFAGVDGPSYLTNVNGTWFFLANDYVHGRELWKVGDAIDASPSDLAIKHFEFADGTVLSLEDIIARANGVIGDQNGTAGDDTLRGSVTKDSIYGLDGNDKITALDQDDYIDGGAGDDVISAGSGNDSVIGGAGNDIIAGGYSTYYDAYGEISSDYLSGSEGNDVYCFNRGDGRDRIDNSPGGSTGDVDTLSFGTGINPTDVTGYVSADGNLVLSVIASNDSVSIMDWFSNYNGGAEDDSVWGSAASDVMIGGPGNDDLGGNEGSDVYCFNRGDGQDRISNWPGSSTGDVDTLSFGAGITPDDLTAYVDSDGNLVLSVQGSDDSVSISQWFDAWNGFSEYPGQELSRVQFIDQNGDARIFDLAGIVSALKDSLLAADAENQVSLFNGATSGFELTGTVELAGGAKAVAYALTGELRPDYVENSDQTLSRVQFTDQNGNARIFDLTGIVHVLKDSLTASDVNNQVSLFNDAMSSFELTGTVPTAGGDYAVAYAQTGDFFSTPTYITGSSGDNVIYGSTVTDTISAGAGNDTIASGAGNDVIDAGDGTDYIDAGAGNDIIQGLQGGDTAIGGTGDDTYYFNFGDGKVSIEDTARPGEGNTIVFGQGITPDAITLSTGSLALKIGTNGDEIDLEVFNRLDAFGEHAIDTFRFADGTVLSYADLLQKGFDFSGTEGEDLMLGTSAADRMIGLGGTTSSRVARATTSWMATAATTPTSSIPVTVWIRSGMRQRPGTAMWWNSVPASAALTWCFQLTRMCSSSRSVPKAMPCVWKGSTRTIRWEPSRWKPSASRTEPFSVQVTSWTWASGLKAQRRTIR